MAKQEKVPGKVKKESNKKFKIEPDRGEVEFEIDLLVDGDYEVHKLKTDKLPTHMPQPDGTKIRWLNNFSIMKDGSYINQPYKVTIPGLSNRGSSKLVIYNGTGDPYYYPDPIDGDTFELRNGDPAGGMAP